MGHAAERAARLSFRAAGAARQNENGPGLVEHRKARALRRGKREPRAADIAGDESSPRAERFTCKFRVACNVRGTISFACATSRGVAIRFSGESCRRKFP